MTEYFLIAKIVSVSGKNGFVKIKSYSDFPERFLNLKKVFVDFFNAKKEITVEEIKHEKDNIYLKFLNFDSPDQVKVFIDKNVYVDTDGLIKLPEDNYFVHDVIGSSVIKEQKPFGVVKDVLSYPANDVYVILKNDGSEFLLPAVLDFIESFDPQKKILTLYPGDIYEDENED